MKKLINISLICFLSASVSYKSFSATEKQMKDAKYFASKGKHSKALKILENSYDPKNTNTQELFLMGLSAKNDGQFMKAEKYLKEALKKEPKSGRIRTELAQLNLKQGKFRQSQKEILSIKRLNPPQSVINKLDVLYSNAEYAINNPRGMKGTSRDGLGGFATAGFAYDSNVNGGPNSDTVFLYGLPFNLSSNAQETSDTSYFIRAGLNHLKQISDNVILRSNAVIAFNDYIEANTYDTLFGSVSTGADFKISDKSSLFVPVVLNLRKFNSQASWFSQDIGLSPRFRYKIKNNLQANVDTSILKRRFNDNSRRNLVAYRLSPSISYQAKRNNNITLGLNLGHESSGQDIYSNNVISGLVGYQHYFNKQGIRAGITATYTDTKFKGIQAAYTEARHDNSTRISLNGSYIIPKIKNLNLNADISYENNDSNLDINTFDRVYTSISFTKRF